MVRSARVSVKAAWRAGQDEESDAKLIRYLWKNKHTTPFESVTFTFEVYAPIFVFRQWHRHRTWSYNELSARYRALNECFYLPSPEMVGEQSVGNKQGRTTEDASRIEERKQEIEELRLTCEKAFGLYRRLLNSKWPRELARSVLPVNTYSLMLGTVNLLNLLKFCTLRCDQHAQYEIRVYADAMRELIRPHVPVCVAAWEGKE